MRARARQLAERLRTSYWFVPSLMSAGAIALFVSMSYLDYRFEADWLSDVAWLGASQPSGARSVLMTIASSMIGVAGVSFSITIAAVSFASANFGPRLLTNFMRDRGNQVTLGTFISTFIYCILALRLVSDGSETASGEQIPAYVPQITVLGALALAAASLGVLIFFLHHVPDSIRISNVIAKIGLSLERRVDKLFVDELGAGARLDCASAPPEDSAPLPSPASGYIQNIDTSTLIEAACSGNLRVWLAARPGDFLHQGQAMGSVESLEGDGVTPGQIKKLLNGFALGPHRTQSQDLLFPVDELVEIAARALSPGINDPVTAMSCLDWLGTALTAMRRRGTPSSLRTDRQGTVRVIAPSIDFAEMMGRVFEQLRHYLAADLNASLHALTVLSRIGSEAGVNERTCVELAAARLVESAEAVHTSSTDRVAISKAWSRLRSALDGESDLLEERFEGTAAQLARS